MASQDVQLSKFEADFKQQQSKMTTKIDTFLKAINDRMTDALPSDIVKNRKLNVNSTSSILSTRSYSMEDPQSSSNPFTSFNAVKTFFKSKNTLPKDQPQIKTLTVDNIETPKLNEPRKALEDEFKDLHFNLPVLEVLDHAHMYNAILDKYVERLANGSKSYPVGIVRDVEAYVGNLKLLEDFYVIDKEKDPTCPLLIRRRFLATASVEGEGITRSIFGVREVGQAQVDVLYWTTIARGKSYDLRPSTTNIGKTQKMTPKKRTTRATPATATTPTTTITNAQLQALIDRDVAAALTERDADRSRNGDNNNDSGTGGRRQITTLRECSYTDFLKCQPMSFQGTEGVVGLTLEKMEFVFQISNCIVICQVKFASCTLQGSALTWWNYHMRAVGQDVTYAMPWAALKRMITDKYCPKGEIQKP
nr:hypothetical protein [Tanacetum cinerariifolium]